MNKVFNKIIIVYTFLSISLLITNGFIYRENNGEFLIVILTTVFGFISIFFLKYLLNNNK